MNELKAITFVSLRFVLLTARLLVPLVGVADFQRLDNIRPKFCVVRY